MNKSEDNMSSDDIKSLYSASTVKIKPKKRSLVERELETSLTARVTSPVTNDGSSKSRYGRARRLKTNSDFCDTDKAVTNVLKSPQFEITTPGVTSPAYKMHAVNSPVRSESPQQVGSLENQIENIYSTNISLSRFGSEEKPKVISPVKKFSKIYIRKDLIQSKEKEKEETITLIKNMFSPVKSAYKPTNSHLSNILERSSEKYNVNSNSPKLNGYIDTSSVVKALDFDNNKKRTKENRENKLVLSKNDLFELEAKCKYQLGDLAWARMSTFPFWPGIVTREPGSEMFVKKKLFGRMERDVVHITFFGDNGRRSWIVDTMLRPFLGQQEFDTTRDQFPPEAKKKDPRLYAAFFISEKKQALWNSSVEEAESLLREPKRLRIDIFYEMLEKSRIAKFTPKSQKSSKITRTDSDVSLSESLFDTLFCEDDGKTDELDRSRTKKNNLDVSEVVTACLDNMAAKTGMTKIQKQSHMDRWLQKAKSKTPEKSQYKITVTTDKVNEEKDIKEKKEIRVRDVRKETKREERRKKNNLTLKRKDSPTPNPYRLRKSVIESQNVTPHVNEHDYSSKNTEKINSVIELDKGDSVLPNIGVNKATRKSERIICVIGKVETLCDKINKTKKKHESLIVNKDLIRVNESKEATGTETEVDTELNKIKVDPSIINKELNVDQFCDLKESTHEDNSTVEMDVDPPTLKEDVLATRESKNCDSLIVEPVKTLQLTQNCSIVEDVQMDDTNQNAKLKAEDDNAKADHLRTIEILNNDSVKDVEESEKCSIVEAIQMDDTNQNAKSKAEDDNAKADHLRNIELLNNDYVKDIEESENCSIVEAIQMDDTNQNAQSKAEDGNAKADHLRNIEIINNDCVKDIEESVGMDAQKTTEKLTCGKSNAELNEPPQIKVHKTINNELPTDDDLTDCDSDRLDKSIDNDDNLLSAIDDLIQNTGKRTEPRNKEDRDTETNIEQVTGNLRENQNTDLITEYSDKQNGDVIGNLGRNQSIEVITEYSDKRNEDVAVSENTVFPKLEEKEKTEIITSYSDKQNRDVAVLEDTVFPQLEENIEFDATKRQKDENINGEIDKGLCNDVSRTETSENIPVNTAVDTASSNTKTTETKEQNKMQIDDQLSSDDGTKENTVDTPKEDNCSIKNETAHIDKDVPDDKWVPECTNEVTPISNLPEIFENPAVTDYSKEDDVESIKEEFDIETSSINSAISDISITENEILTFKNGVPKPIVNGFHGDYLDKIKAELLQDSDTASMSSEYDNMPLKELKVIAKKILCNEVDKVSSDSDNITLNNLRQRSKNASFKDGLNKVVRKQGTNDIYKCISNDAIDSVNAKSLKVKILKVNLSKIDIDMNYGVYKTSSKRTLRTRASNSPAEFIKQNGFHDSNDSSPVRIKEEEPDTISINSEDSNMSLSKRKHRKEKVVNVKKEDKKQDPEFLKYLECRQDSLIDEHPELTHDEIVAYLYKTWLYEESFKSDIKKTDDAEQSNLVKGLKNKTPPKRVRTKARDKRKLIDMDKVFSKESKKITDFAEFLPKEKPKRKIIQPYYNENYSDIEDEIELFEIFKKKPKKEKVEVVKSIEVIKSEETIPTESIKIERDIKTEFDAKVEPPDMKETIDISSEEYYDEEEVYFEQLTEPKPNIFKGMVREKVCEICDETANLVKCKGCNGMFHVDCVKKETEIVEVPTPSRGRKKKINKRGRRPKASMDSNGLDSESQSDEKSHDPNASEEQNVSIDDESHIVADAETFEAQLAAKMKQMLETAEIIDLDLYSSDDGLDWSDTETGKCKIVDIKLKPKRVDNTDYSDFKCKNCQQYDTPICFVCKSPVSPKEKIEHRQRCQVAHCHKYYHLECLDHWPQTQFNSGEPSRSNKKISEHFEALSCPRHVCHTCVCDDPRGCKTRFSGDKLARCVKCPATYHSFTKCLPAGSKILTASLIICPRHYEHRPGKVPCHVNTGWCFICALGGSLICCEYCPTSFHAECLNISAPEGTYMCEDCETGRLPLYGEMVWVKLGHYRWWPGIVLHPSEIPDNILAVKHSFGEFVVRFFGQYDHYWVNRGRVFPFQEGDSGRISSQKSKIDEAFTKAMEHAHRAFEILKNMEPNDEESLDIASSLLPPHYVKLRVNKPCGSLYGRKVDSEESSLTQCECSPDEEDPCGPDAHCLNRMLLTECGPTCRAGERCSNRAFEKRLYPKLTAYRTPHRGWGLKTLEDIKAGQFVIEYVGELIDEGEFQRRMRRKHEIRDENFYFLTLDKERMIDAGPKGNLARFMNHCCEPNCETQKWTVLGDVRVGLFALRDIPANTEVTFNYNLECAGIEKKRCLCGAKRCSGFMGAKPKQDESQCKKPKVSIKRPYKKRKNVDDSPSTSTAKPKRPVGRPAGRPAKPRELTEIEKDLLIIKNATSISSDSEGSRLSSVDAESEKKDAAKLKRKRVSISDETTDRSSPSVKRVKLDNEKTATEVGD